MIFQRFRCSKSIKNRLGQKFKIPVAYVFLCDHFAHAHPFWCKSDESPRTSSRKCVKMPHFDLLFDLCDLDLGHMTLSFAPGRSVTQYQYSLQVSRKSDDGKGAKRVWQTDRQTDRRTAGRTDGQDHSYICQVADKNQNSYSVVEA